MDTIKTYLQGLQFKIVKTGDSNVHFKRFDCDNISIILNNDLQYFHISCDTIDQEILKEKTSELLTEYTDTQEIIGKLIDFIIVDDEEEEVDDEEDDKKDEGEIKEELYLPKIDHKTDRKLTIYVWGRKKRKGPPCDVEHNFNAAVLSDKKKNVDWRQNGRDSEEVRWAVMRARGFTEFMAAMIKTIEGKDCHIIGINCRAGRHRSCSTAFFLKKYYYSGAIIHFVELPK